MKYWFCLMTLFFTNNTWAQDPFDKTQREHSQLELTETGVEEDEETFSTKTNTCGADENRQAADISLRTLKLVGVIISKEQAFALLLDKELQLYSVPEGTDVAKEGYVLEKINKDKVQFMRKHGTQCSQTELKELTF